MPTQNIVLICLKLGFKNWLKLMNRQRQKTSCFSNSIQLRSILQYFDIIEEQRTNDEQPLDELKTDVGTGPTKTNALELVKQRLSKEIARGLLEVREKDSQIMVEVIEGFGGEGEIENEAKLPGEVNASLLELYLQIATAQVETGDYKRSGARLQATESRKF